MYHILKVLVAAILLFTSLLKPAGADAVTAGELTKWCSVEDAQELSIDDQMDQISCLVFLQGVVAGISTAAIHLEDEYWAAGFDSSGPPSRFYCGDFTMEEMRQRILPYLKQNASDDPAGGTVLWSLERAFPCWSREFW